VDANGERTAPSTTRSAARSQGVAANRSRQQRHPSYEFSYTIPTARPSRWCHHPVGIGRQRPHALGRFLRPRQVQAPARPAAARPQLLRERGLTAKAFALYYTPVAATGLFALPTRWPWKADLEQHDGLGRSSSPRRCRQRRRATVLATTSRLRRDRTTSPAAGHTPRPPPDAAGAHRAVAVHAPPPPAPRTRPGIPTPAAQSGRQAHQVTDPRQHWSSATTSAATRPRRVIPTRAPPPRSMRPQPTGVHHRRPKRKITHLYDVSAGTQTRRDATGRC